MCYTTSFCQKLFCCHPEKTANFAQSMKSHFNFLTDWTAHSSVCVSFTQDIFVPFVGVRFGFGWNLRRDFIFDLNYVRGNIWEEILRGWWLCIHCCLFISTRWTLSSSSCWESSDFVLPREKWEQKRVRRFFTRIVNVIAQTCFSPNKAISKISCVRRRWENKDSWKVFYFYLERKVPRFRLLKIQFFHFLHEFLRRVISVISIIEMSSDLLETLTFSEGVWINLSISERRFRLNFELRCTNCRAIVLTQIDDVFWQFFRVLMKNIS